MSLSELLSYVAPYYGPITAAIIKVPHLIRVDQTIDAAVLGSGKGLNRFRMSWIIND
jgi:hypothetical protein